MARLVARLGRGTAFGGGSMSAPGVGVNHLAPAAILGGRSSHHSLVGLGGRLGDELSTHAH